ncbi:MAG: site-2 protease family protein [Polyangiaceae bacterium]
MGFRLFGVDVEVHFTFWLTTLLFGTGMGANLDPVLVGIWVVVVFISVLVHELGHAIAVKRYGLEPAIRLHGMGGTTHYRVVLNLPRRAEIIISLAGPFAGFLFGALVIAVDVLALHSQSYHLSLSHTIGARPGILAHAIQQLLYVNFFWGFINLIPVLPLDGGHVLEAALGPRRARLTSIISLVAAVVAAAAFVAIGMWWAAFIFGMGAFHAVRRLQSEDPVDELPERRAAPREPPIPGEIIAKLRAARRALEDEDLVQATLLANESVRMTGDYEQPLPRVKVEAYDVLGWVAQLRGDIDEAARWIKAAQQHGTPDAALMSAVLIARGETREARKLLEQARATGDDRKEIVGPLIQILIAEGEVARAAAIAFDIVESLSDDDARRMADIAFTARAFDWSARLFEAVFQRTGAADDAYQTARAHAADGSNDRALDYLARAVSAGFSDRARAWSDAALEPLRAGHKLETVVPRP